MKSSPATTVVLAAVLSLAGLPAAAQIPSPTGNVYGTALDEQGKVLAGATVTLTGPGAARTSVTDGKGDFHFLGLSPGEYTVILELRGFAPATRDAAVELEKNMVLSITMSLAGATESVAVSAEGPLLDSRKTETGATFGREELETIPTTRDPWAIVRQVPGVLLATMNVGGGESASQATFVGKGSHADQNTYNLDGVAVTDMAATGSTPIYFDFDSLSSIEIATGGSDPSLSTPGVTVNLVTRRGTNQLVGSARTLYTGGGAGWDYGVEAGGPLWKDRIWLWGAAARNSYPEQTTLNAEEETLHSMAALRHYNAKLDAQLVGGNALALSYLNFEKIFDGRGAGPDKSQAATWNQTLRSRSYRAEDSQVLSEKLFASAYFSYLSSGNAYLPQGGIDQQADLDADYVWHNSYAYAVNQHPQHQAGLTVSGFFDTGDLRHEVKFGFGYKHFRANSLTSWPGNGLAALTPFGAAGITRAFDVKYEMNYYDSFVGDTVQAGNLTLNAGLRFDYQRGRNLPSRVPANPAFPDVLPAVSYGGNSGYPITWRLLQPRVGATYALGKEKKTLARASYSRFASQLGSEVLRVNAFPGVAYEYYVWNDVNLNGRVEPEEVDFSYPVQGFSNVDPTNPGSVEPVNRIARDFRPPTTDEILVGLDREISSDLSASVAYTHRWLRHLEFSPLIGTTRADFQFLGNATGAVSANGLALDFSVPYYGLTTDPPPVGTILQNRPDATESYDGIEVQVVKRRSHGWMLRGSFAYNDWRQRVGPGAIVDPNGSVPNANVSGPVVEATGDRFGPIFINSKWQFNVSGLVQLPLGVVAGANFFGRQGYPVVDFVGVSIPDSRQLSQGIQIGSTTAHRLPAVFELDLHAEKTFRFGSAIAVTPVLDCFNVIDSRTVLARNGKVGSYDASRPTPFKQNGSFGQPVELLRSRVLRGGVRIAF